MSQFSLLKTRRFLPLFVVQFLGAFNDNLFKNAFVMMLTYGVAASPGMDPRIMVTAAAGVFILPFFLFSATAGQLADKFDKSFLTRYVKLAEIVLMVLAAAGLYLSHTWFLMGVLFLMGAQSAIFGPIKYSILPDHLEEDEIIGGNALVEAGTFLAILLGTIAGGLLIMREGGAVIVSVFALLCAGAGYFASLKMPSAPPSVQRMKLSYNIFSETVKIIRHAQGNKDVFAAIIGVSWFWLLGFTFLAQFPAYAKDVLGGDAGVVTLLLTVFSVGIGLGSLVCGKILKGRVSGALVPLGAFGMTAMISLLWLASPAPSVYTELSGVAELLANHESWPLLFAICGISVFGGIYIVPLYAIMQTRCDPAHRARTIAANNVMNALFMVGAAVLTMGMLKMQMTIPGIFLTIGIMNVPVALIVRRKKVNE